MKKNNIQSLTTQIIVTGIRSKVDGSLGITASTPELTPEEKAEFMRLQNLVLMCSFTPTDYKEAPEYKISKEIDQKTPSQRLRNVLYVLWEQEGSKGDFDTFYKEQLNKIIEHYKSKLG